MLYITVTCHDLIVFIVRVKIANSIKKNVDRHALECVYHIIIIIICDLL